MVIDECETKPVSWTECKGCPWNGYCIFTKEKKE